MRRVRPRCADVDTRGSFLSRAIVWHVVMVNSNMPLGFVIVKPQ